MISDNFQLVLILQELKKLNKTVIVFKEAIEAYNTESVDLIKENYNISTNASDECGTGEEPVIIKCPARQDDHGGMSAGRVRKLIKSVEDFFPLHNTTHFHKAFVKN